MKRRFFLLVAPLLAGAIAAVLLWRPGADPQQAAEQTRRLLRQQGFKTDLSEFDFSTTPQIAARAAALTNISYVRPTVLLQPCGPDSAIVAWKQSTLDEPDGFQNSRSAEQMVSTDRDDLDAACAAALAGPIRFPLIAAHGSSMLLVHLAPLKNLAETLAVRMIVELREKQPDAAWTNLLALTRLSNAWEPDPSEISHLVRFNLARVAAHAAWQALQWHDWNEAQLAALQREWESADFFKSLPETAAFTRASIVDACIRERLTPPPPGVPLKTTVQNALHSPTTVVGETKYRWKRARYRTQGTFEDERDLLLFFRDREIELRQGVLADNWAQMRACPGVTNAVSFQSTHHSNMQMMLNARQLSFSFHMEGKGLLGRAAETEARRRIVLTAIAFEKYRLRHGAYPKDLQSLVPEILKSVPLDFMDGQPLRYRINETGQFVLYSVGLNCADDGGTFPKQREDRPVYPNQDPTEGPDLVWPRPATYSETQSFRADRERAKDEKLKASQSQERERERQTEVRRQQYVALLEAIYGRAEPPKLPDPKLNGKHLSELLRNNSMPAHASAGMAQLLTLRQVSTGEEPDIATFELPIRYDALTNLGRLRLLCDAAPNENGFAAEAEFQECIRATNGNCQLLWNTTYDPPGRHFLQAELYLEKSRARSQRGPTDDEDESSLKGPLFPYMSTNLLQFYPLRNAFTRRGAFFRAKLAHPVGSYTLEISTPSGEHLHTISGSTTDGIVNVDWDLSYAGGKRYTNNSFKTSWNVTFPDATNGP